MREKLLQLLEQKGGLPPFPEVLRKLQTTINDPHASLDDLVRIIAMDASLAGNILKMANSPFYRTGLGEIATLSVAVNRLGFDAIRQIVYALAFTRLFVKNPVLDYRSFWRHSLAVALFTTTLGRYVEVPAEVQEASYLSGLMHDIGIMVFACLMPQEYAAFLKTVGDREEPFEAQEQRRFGIDHAELGARFIARWWHLDPRIAQAVRDHHFPFRGSWAEKRCGQLVNVANGLCNLHGFDNGIACFHQVFKEGAWEGLGLSLTQVEDLMADLNHAIEEAGLLIGLR